MKAYTDYPFKHLGDRAGEPAPIRQVEVLAWNGDKYALVKYRGKLIEFKRWYLYTKPLQTAKPVSEDPEGFVFPIADHFSEGYPEEYCDREDIRYL